MADGFRWFGIDGGVVEVNIIWKRRYRDILVEESGAFIAINRESKKETKIDDKIVKQANQWQILHNGCHPDQKSTRATARSLRVSSRLLDWCGSHPSDAWAKELSYPTTSPNEDHCLTQLTNIAAPLHLPFRYINAVFFEYDNRVSGTTY